jgi:DNA-directed RNA polymerase subunit RPC12/RpoP
MTTTAPPRVFADLAPAGLEMSVKCQRCGHEAVVDDAAPGLRHQRIAGRRRYRCQQCGAIGLPSTRYASSRRARQQAEGRP